MDCFHDFCIGCDRESPNGPYCSQACRLADLEKANPLNNPTSSNPASSRTQQETSLASSGTASGARYILAPAYKFPGKDGNRSQPTNDNTKLSSSPSLPSQSFEQNVWEQSSRRQRSLTPSSSRSSLSTRSSSNPNSISDQAMRELREYFRSFDEARASKRRQSVC